jgi:AbrB family looped-hinge helix DNA binding protein
MIREEMKIGPKGQVVIPKVFRKTLGLYPGSRVSFTLKKDGLLLEKMRDDVVAVFKEIAEGGKSVKVKPHEYVEEIEERLE